jgi:hypothetical protein
VTKLRDTLTEHFSEMIATTPEVQVNEEEPRHQADPNNQPRSSCLIRLAGRVQCVHNEAFVMLFSTLPPYAVEMLQGRAEVVQQDELVQLSSPHPTIRLNIDTAQEAPTSP